MLTVVSVTGLVSLPGSEPATRTFSVNDAQAREVAAVVEFVRAYNSGRVNDALAVLRADAGVTDCDYRRVAVTRAVGKAQIARWLRQRFADKDRLTLGRIYNENPEGRLLVGVEFVRRASKTLRALGSPAASNRREARRSSSRPPTGFACLPTVHSELRQTCAVPGRRLAALGDAEGPGIPSLGESRTREWRGDRTSYTAGDDS